jgi:hypothetical protein
VAAAHRRGPYRADLRTAVIVGLMAGLAADLDSGPAFGFDASVVFGPAW